jgi:DNA-binding PadR family transcriptional regulator
MRYTRDNRHRRHHPEGMGHEAPFAGHDGHEHGPDARGDHHGGPGHHPRGGRGGWDGRRGRGRAGRGDVRTAVLILLAEQPMHGYQLMQAMAERTNGVWRPSPGAIYPTIAQLEDEGLVTTVAEGGRKLVTLTDAGRTSLADNAGDDPFAALAGTPGQAYDLRSALEEIHVAARLLGRNGTDAQAKAAQQVLTETRRSLYLILAEGGETSAAEAGS